jgi:hypothetical protein
MARIAPLKTPAQAAANYARNGGSPTAAALWATNLSADLPAVFAAAKAAGPTWQQNVNTPQALLNYGNGLTRASNNTAPIIAKINGPSKNTFQQQVTAAGGPGGKYTGFAGAWMPAVSTQVANLDRTNPRGPSGTNQARMDAQYNWAVSQHGKFKQ